MATENGDDIMEELTTGTTELTERVVARAARAASSAAAGAAGDFFDVHTDQETTTPHEEGAAIPLLPDWIAALPSAVDAALTDSLGEHWSAALVIVVCVVVVPAAMMGGALWGRIFRWRREEARGLIDRKTSGFGFGGVDGLGTHDDVEHQRRRPICCTDDGQPGPGCGNTKSSCGLGDGKKKASEIRRTRNQDLADRGNCTAGTAAKGRSATAGQEFAQLKMTKSGDENPPAASEAAAPDAHADASPKEEADDSTAGDTDAAIGVCDDTLKTGGDDDEEEDLESSELEAAPLHLHTLRVPARLRGSSTPIGVRSRSSSRSRSNSRDVSPTPASKSGSDKGSSSGGKHRRTSSRESDKVPSLVPGTETSGGTVSSGSSVVDSEIDPDILLDRAGFEELEPPPPHEIAMGPLASPAMQGMHSSGLLTSVNERMSEETLDDCHAFTDLTTALHHSLRSLKEGEGGGDGKDMLDPLPEDDNEEDDDDYNGLTEEERMKLIKKQKDIEAKKRQEEEAEKAKAASS